MTNGWMVAAVALVLFIFGYGYNRWVAYLEEKNYQHGYVALLVVGGVAMTLVGAGLIIGWTDAMYCALMFGASGFWMVMGSIERHNLARGRAETLVREWMDDEKTVGRIQHAGGDYAGDQREPAGQGSLAADDR